MKSVNKFKNYLLVLFLATIFLTIFFANAASARTFSSITVGAQSGAATYGTASTSVKFTITWNTTKTGTLTSGNFTVTGLPAGATGSFSLATLTATNTTPSPTTLLTITTTTMTAAGTFTITISDGSGHSKTGSFVIGKRPLNFTGTKVYDAANTFTAIQLIAANIANGDAVTLGGSATVSSINVASYISFTKNSLAVSSSNYSVTGGIVNVTITKMPLTINGVTANNKTYNALTTATLNTTKATLSGVLINDVANVKLNSISAKGLFTNKNAGTAKSVTTSGFTITGTATANYNLIQPNTTANISTLALTITAVANSKAYDGTTSSATMPKITKGAIQGTDKAAFLQNYNNKNVGVSKTLIPAGVVTDGNSGNNYTYTFITNATGTITALSLTISGSASTKTYDGGISSPVAPSITVGTLQIGDAANFIQEYFDASIGTGKVIIPSGQIADGNNGNNYKYVFVNTFNGTISGVPIAAADFRSRTSGNFSSAAIWEYNPGGGNWLTTTLAPVSTNNITLLNGHNIILDADYTVGAGKTLLMNTGSTLTIQPNVNLNAATASTLDFNGQSVTIKSTATGTGSIGKILGTISNATNITVERFIPFTKRAWRLLSVPVTGTQTIRQAWQENGINNNGYGTLITTAFGTSAYPNGFDTTTFYSSIRKYNGASFEAIPNTFTPIASAGAYFIYLRGDRTINPYQTTTATSACTLRTNGTLKSGDQDIPTSALSSFTLVGNPYASAIDFEEVYNNTSTTKANVSHFLYMWDAQQGLTGGFITFNGIDGYSCTPCGSWGGANSKILSGQAFFISSTAGGNVRIEENDKTSGTSSTALRPSQNLVKLSTILYGAEGKIYDGNSVIFDKNYSNAVDAKDALKLTNPGENFALTRDGKILAAETRNTIKSGDVVYFEMNNMKQQEYSLEFSASNISKEVTAYFEDSYLGSSTQIDLTKSNKVKFTITADVKSATSNRFKMVFSAALIGIKCKPSIKIAPNPVESGIVNMQFTQKEQGRYRINLLDVTGRNIFSTIFNFTGGTNNQAFMLPSTIKTGIYQMVIIGTDNKKQVEKLFINSVK